MEFVVWTVILLFAVFTSWVLLRTNRDDLDQVRQRERALKAMERWTE